MPLLIVMLWGGHRRDYHQHHAFRDLIGLKAQGYPAHELSWPVIMLKFDQRGRDSVDRHLFRYKDRLQSFFERESFMLDIFRLAVTGRLQS